MYYSMKVLHGKWHCNQPDRHHEKFIIINCRHCPFCFRRDLHWCLFLADRTSGRFCYNVRLSVVCVTTTRLSATASWACWPNGSLLGEVTGDRHGVAGPSVTGCCRYRRLDYSLWQRRFCQYLLNVCSSKHAISPWDNHLTVLFCRQ